MSDKLSSSLIEEICKRDDPTLLDSFPSALQWHTCLPWVRKYRAMRVFAWMAPKVSDYLSKHWDDIFLDARAVQLLVEHMDIDCWPTLVFSQNDTIIGKHWLSSVVGNRLANTIFSIKEFKTMRARVDRCFYTLGNESPSTARIVAELVYLKLLEATSSVLPDKEHCIHCYNLVTNMLSGMIDGGHLEYIEDTTTPSLLIEIGNIAYVGWGVLPWESLIKNFNPDLILETIGQFKKYGRPEFLEDYLGVRKGMIRLARRFGDAKWLVDDSGCDYAASSILFQVLAGSWAEARLWLCEKSDIDHKKVQMVDVCMRLGIVSAEKTPELTMGHEPSLMDQALLYGYAVLCQYLRQNDIEPLSNVRFSDKTYSKPAVYNTLLANNIVPAGLLFNVCRSKNMVGVGYDSAHTTNRLLLTTLASGQHKLSAISFVEIVGEFAYDGRHRGLKRFNPSSELQLLRTLWSISSIMMMLMPLNGIPKYFIRSTPVMRYMRRRFNKFIYPTCCLIV